MKTTKTSDRLLEYIKLNGPQAVNDLAKTFGMTNEGMRLQVLKLEEMGLIESESHSKGVGRPTILYQISAKGNHRFTDNHAKLTVQLLESVQELFGKESLELMMETKRKYDFERYEKALAQASDIETKLNLFTELRDKEGYMTKLEQDNEGWTFIENHCPICNAANHYDGFCRSEIENIRRLLGEKVEVERKDHSISGDRRCSYRIRRFLS
jgi:predicted ArsR family transcriptional regulator